MHELRDGELGVHPVDVVADLGLAGGAVVFHDGAENGVGPGGQGHGFRLRAREFIDFVNHRA